VTLAELSAYDPEHWTQAQKVARMINSDDTWEDVSNLAKSLGIDDDTAEDIADELVMGESL
jgi:hypothetical protein